MKTELELREKCWDVMLAYLKSQHISEEIISLLAHPDKNPFTKGLVDELSAFMHAALVAERREALEEAAKYVDEVMANLKVEIFKEPIAFQWARNGGVGTGIRALKTDDLGRT